MMWMAGQLSFPLSQWPTSLFVEIGLIADKEQFSEAFYIVFLSSFLWGEKFAFNKLESGYK